MKDEYSLGWQVLDMKESKENKRQKMYSNKIEHFIKTIKIACKMDVVWWRCSYFIVETVICIYIYVDVLTLMVHCE